MPDQHFPTVRPRRLRRTAVLRSMVRENAVTMDDLIYPIFVEEGLEAPAPVESMPGVVRIPEIHLAHHVKAIADAGVRAIMMFGVSRKKDATGSDSWAADGLQARMIASA
jgi:porphobilinogen synthase